MLVEFWPLGYLGVCNGLAMGMTAADGFDEKDWLEAECRRTSSCVSCLAWRRQVKTMGARSYLPVLFLSNGNSNSKRLRMNSCERRPDADARPSREESNRQTRLQTGIDRGRLRGRREVSGWSEIGGVDRMRWWWWKSGRRRNLETGGY